MTAHLITPTSSPGKSSPAEASDGLKTLPIAEVQKQLGALPDGLSDAEAKKRLTQYGLNEIEALNAKMAAYA